MQRANSEENDCRTIPENQDASRGVAPAEVIRAINRRHAAIICLCNLPPSRLISSARQSLAPPDGRISRDYRTGIGLVTEFQECAS